MLVPFSDLKAHHDPIRPMILASIEEVMNRSAFAGGLFVEKFENEFAAYCQSQYAIGLGSGTEALWLSLLAIGVGPGDEVIVPTCTFAATAEAIVMCGAKPAFADIRGDTYTLDPGLLESAINPRTKAIIPVHLFGQTADMDPIMETARRFNLHVIEDACQAHGAVYKDKKAGAIGHLGCFSFYPSKNLGAIGEAGAIVTNDGALQEKIRRLRNHGQYRKYRYSEIGWNARMDGIQAAVLRLKLKYLDQHNEARRDKARLYAGFLANLDNLVLPKERAPGEHVYHLYVVRTQDRDIFMQCLGKRGIACGNHYPVPLHLQEAYTRFGYQAGDFPVAERCAQEFLSLPMFPELRPEQVEAVSLELKLLLSLSYNPKAHLVRF